MRVNRQLNDEQLGETSIINSKSKGSFLEWIIKRIFQSIGFYATNTANIHHNQIDVLINIDGIKIVCECKQYEKNTIAVKNLVHEWSSKRHEMGFDKVILVLWGYPDVQDSDMELAKRLNVNIWHDKKIEKYINAVFEDKSKAREEILVDLDISNVETEKIKENITARLEKIFFNTDIDAWKNEILSCYSDEIILDPFKYKIIFNILKRKKMFIEAKAWGGPKIFFRNINDIDIQYLKDYVESGYGPHAYDESGMHLIYPKDIFKET